jgi:hypothetical protein
LAELVGTSKETIRRAEQCGDHEPKMRGETLLRLIKGFENAGIVFANDGIRIDRFETERASQMQAAE